MNKGIRYHRIIAFSVAVMVGISLFLTLTTMPVHATENKPLSGKTVLVDGDSINSGFGRYIHTAMKSMGAKKVKNISRSGSTIAWGKIKKRSTWWKINKMSPAQIRKYNYIVIATGTNDYFGYFRVKPGTANSTNVKTAGGALNTVIKKIQKASPNTKIVIVTPIHRYAKNTNCNNKKNRYGKTLADYRNVINEVAAKYDNVYVINGEDVTRADEMRKRANTEDGLHPTKKYAKKVLVPRFKAQFIEKVINKPAPLENDNKPGDY